jgi:hypothetical protein
MITSIPRFQSALNFEINNSFKVEINSVFSLATSTLRFSDLTLVWETHVSNSCYVLSLPLRLFLIKFKISVRSWLRGSQHDLVKTQFCRKPSQALSGKHNNNNNNNNVPFQYKICFHELQLCVILIQVSYPKGLKVVGGF